MNDRYYWADVLTELRQALIRVEGDMTTRLRSPMGVWVDQFVSGQIRSSTDLAGGLSPYQPAAVPAAEAAPAVPAMSSAEAELFARRYGIRPPGAPAGAPPAPPAAEAPPVVPAAEAAPPAVGPDGLPIQAAASTPTANTNEISKITVTFRAIDLSKKNPSANTEIAFAVLNELRNSASFDPKETEFSGNISAVEPPGTFTFPVTVKLKRPLKLQ
jgi:hypothetical protein